MILSAYVLLGLEQGISAALAQPGTYHASPGLLLILAVFVGLWAPGALVVWTWLLLGVLYDLSHPVMTQQALAQMDAAIIGPGAAAFLLGAGIILRLRPMVYRNSWVSIALFTFIAGLVVHLVIVLIYALRGVGFFPFPGESLTQWSWSGELVSRFISLVMTALLAVPIGWTLLRLCEVFGFENAKNAGKRR